MTQSDVAIVVSLMITVVLFGLSWLVIDEWGSHLVRRGRICDAKDWLLLGIVFSFVASIADNIYWGLAWFARLMDVSQAEWLFDHGVYSNIVFRQGMKLVAAWCHLKAAVESGALSPVCLRRAVMILVVLSVMTGGVLVVLRLSRADVRAALAGVWDL